MSVQVIADAAARLVSASASLPGSAHDLTAARTHGIIEAYQEPAAASAGR